MTKAIHILNKPCPRRPGFCHVESCTAAGTRSARLHPCAHGNRTTGARREAAVAGACASCRYQILWLPRHDLQGGLQWTLSAYDLSACKGHREVLMKSTIWDPLGAKTGTLIRATSCQCQRPGECLQLVPRPLGGSKK